MSADYLRCIQTVQPLGDAVGLEVVEEPLFSEDGYPGHEDDVLALLRSYSRPPHATDKKASVWSLTFDGRRLFSAEYLPPPALG